MHEEGDNCNGFNYYLSWKDFKEGEDTTLYLCQYELETDRKVADVEIKEKNGYFNESDYTVSYFYDYGYDIYKIYAPYLQKPQMKNNIKYKPYNNNYYVAL